MIVPSMISDSPRPAGAIFPACLRTLASATCWLLFLAPTVALAQNSDRKIDLPELANAVPADAGIFIEIEGLTGIDTLLSQRDTWRMIRHMLGDEQDGWQKLLAETLGAKTSDEITALVRERVAVAARDWEHLADGIIIFTLPSPDALRRDADQPRYQAAQRIGDVRIMQSETGLWIAKHGRTVILSQSYVGDSFLRDAVDLLAGRANRSLASDEPFRRLIRGLPSPRAGCIYWKRAGEAAATTQPTLADAGPWPALRRGAISLHFRRNRLEVFLQGEPELAADPGYRPRIVYDRVAALPQTTLAAWSGSMDVSQIYDIAIADDSIPGLSNLIEPLRDPAMDEAFRDDVIANLGPRFIVAISADLLSGTMAPRIAVMIESTDATGVATRLKEFFEEIAAGSDEEQAQPRLHVETSEYLGAEILELHLPSTEARDKRRTLATLIARNLTPSIAAVRGWVVASTSAEHIRRIIESSNGLNAVLGEVPVITRSERTLRRSISAAVVQPALAMSTLKQWIDWMDSAESDELEQHRLGIRLRAEPDGGMVVIEDVASNGPSIDVLEPGDAIIGFGKRLLAMHRPHDDLEAMLSAADPQRPVRLRIMRHGEMHEAMIVPAQPDVPEPVQEISLRRLGLLRNVASELATAVYSVARSSPTEYRAYLVLEFEEVPAEESPAEPVPDARPPE